MNSKFTQDKVSVRQKLKKQRGSIDKNKVSENSFKIFQKIIALDWFLKFNSYLLYLPINNEVGTQDLINFLKKQKSGVYLPAFDGKKWEMRRFDGFDNLEIGPFGIKQPKKGSFVINDVDVCILPGIAFAKNGLRVGYGHGIYDLLLKNSKSYKIGLCWDFQIVNGINADKHDVLINVLVTEKKIYLL